MDTSLPRLSQLEVDLAAAQRSIGAAGGPHPAAAGHQAAAPEVDAFMVRLLQLINKNS